MSHVRTSLRVRGRILAGCRTELVTRPNHRHCSGIRPFASISRHASVDDHFLTKLEGVLVPVLTPESTRTTHFKTPVFGLARRFVLHIDVEPDVRIRPLKLR